MICQYCGKEIEEGLTFCTNCGEPLTEDATRPVPRQKPSGVLGPVLIVLAFAAAVAVAAWLIFFRGAAPQGEKELPAQTEPTALTEAPTQSETPTETEAEEEIEIPRVVVDEAAYKTMAEDYAQAILLRDLDTIGGETHPLLKEAFLGKFGSTDFVFERCVVRADEMRKLRRAEERAHEAALRGEFGVDLFIQDAYAVTVDFDADYQGKTYGGAIVVVVADINDENNVARHYVIMSKLDAMDEAFYEDHFAPGDHYFDTHSEE